MPYIVRTGSFVRYRTAAGRVRHAVVTAVTDQTTINLRIGNGSTKQSVTGAVKKQPHDGGGAGWMQGSR
jgi:hypothetical protein